MKFQFKEGQWLDIRKLTNWQKQWCLDNLEFLTLSKSDFAAEHFSFWLYQEWRNLGYYFGSASKPYIQSENEITFNDFYCGEDEEVTQESIFDNPRWVTFDASQDLMGCFLDVLIDGKDYKVSKTKTLTGGDKNYLLENGVRAHESYFHKVTPEDLKPVVKVEEEDSFDNLVYSSPKYIDNNTYYVIEKDKLSYGQWSFVIDNVPLDNEPEDNETYLNLDPDSKKWFGDTYKSENQDIYISFNDLFQEVITHQD